MQEIFPGQRVQYRKRYNSMQLYTEFKKQTGHSPVMPDPPNFKPEVDPFDVPELELEEEQKFIQPTNQKQIKRIDYRLETIPEVEGSENNSIDFQSPYRNFHNFKPKLMKLQKDSDELQTIQPGKRQRYRQRCNSENILLTKKVRIIDFLSSSVNQDDEGKAKKKIKLT